MSAFASSSLFLIGYLAYHFVHGDTKFQGRGPVRALYLVILHRHPALSGRIAIMTGDAEAAQVRAWLQHNPCTVLKKPFDLKEIVGWARDVLERTDRQTGNG